MLIEFTIDNPLVRILFILKIQVIDHKNLQTNNITEDFFSSALVVSKHKKYLYIKKTNFQNFSYICRKLKNRFSNIEFYLIRKNKHLQSKVN
jgi:hypothetical protein